MRNVMILGSNGLLGTNLVDLLSSMGFHVYALDRYSSPPRFHVPKNVHLIQKDFLNEGGGPLRELAKTETVIDLIGRGTPGSAALLGDTSIQEQVDNLSSFLERCVDSGVRDFHYLSSGGSLFGNTSQRLVSEEEVPHPLSAYARTKLTLEEVTTMKSKELGINHVIHRAGNFWGTPIIARPNHSLITTVLLRISHGQPVLRLGDGKMVRDYIFARDAARMVATIASAETRRHATYNIGTGIGTTVNKILKEIRKAIGQEFEIITQPQPVDYVNGYALDIRRYVEEFGQPTFTSFRAGIESMWKQLSPL